MNRLRCWAIAAGLLWMIVSSPAEERSLVAGATHAQTVLLGDSQHRWLLGIDPQQGLNHFGLDSEGTGREKSNLLAAPIGVSWTGGGGPATHWQQAGPGTWTCVVSGAESGSSVTWSVTRGASGRFPRLRNSAGMERCDLAAGIEQTLVPAGQSGISGVLSRCTRLPHGNSFWRDKGLE